jgi:hypothetical protein
MSRRILIQPFFSANCLILPVLLLLALSANAEELVLGVASQYVYNSNFFSAADNEEDASSFLIGPTLQLSETEGRFVYDVNFLGAYEVFVDQSGVNAWESRLRARANYDITSRTSVQVTERFRDVSNLRFSRQDIALADNALDPNQDRYLRNDVEVELIHQLARLLEVRVRGANYWIDFDDNIDRNDSNSFEVGSELRYQVAATHALGIGASYLNQDFDEALSRLGSTSESVTAFASWTWDIADNIVFTANGGPSWIRSDESDTTEVKQTQYVGGSSGGDLFRANIGSCESDPIPGTPVASNCDFSTPAFPPIPAADLGPEQSFALIRGQRVGVADEFTFFGGASLLANFASWNLEATYSRRQSTTSGAGLASSLDRIYVECEFAPQNLRWSTFVAANWNRREALTEATVVDFTVVDGGGSAAQRAIAFTSINSQQNRRDDITAIVGIRTAFTRNQNATFEFRYRRTEGRSRDADIPEIDTYFAVATFDYTLDPMRFRLPFLR